MRLFLPQLRIVQSGLFEYHPARGYQLKKNLKTHRLSRNSSRYYVETNNLGYRDRPINTYADHIILTIGDSHTFGSGVDQNQTYPDILEQNLTLTYGKVIDVVNGGVPAYGWLEELNQITESLEKFSPDVVVMQTSWNDINNNGMGIPKFMIDRNGNLIKHYSKKRPGGFGNWGMKTAPMSQFQKFALKHSHIATLLIGHWHKMLYAWYKDEIDAEIESYKWEISTRVLKEIKALLNSRKIPLLMVIHPGARPADYKVRVAMTQRIISFCKDIDIPYINLANEMISVDNPDELYLPKDEHFNEHGYLWMSKIIAERMSGYILEPSFLPSDSTTHRTAIDLSGIRLPAPRVDGAKFGLS